MLHLSRLTSLALAIAIVIGAPLAQAAEKTAPATPAAVSPAKTNATAKPPLPLDELRTFAEVMDRVKAAYVEPVDDKTLLENAIKGMLSNLDPHSAYLGPEDFRSCRKAPAASSVGWASKSASRTVWSRWSRPSTTHRRPRLASRQAT